MRSFGTRDADPFQACIWQVGRATSAAPTFFLPIEIGDVVYGDGGTGWNNPTKEAILEAHSIWPNRPIGIVVSIGTGLEDSLQLKDKSTKLPELAQTFLNNTSPRRAFQLAVAEYAVQCLTSCEMVHREIAQHPQRDILDGNYFRLNVLQGMSSIGLDEWDKLKTMKALTDQYMQLGEMKEPKRKIADLLRHPQHASWSSYNF